jgi:hypothetical protein
MKKTFAVAGILAGGVALVGVAGSAYGQGGKPTATATRPAKGTGPVIMSCTRAGTHVSGKPGKSAGSRTKDGKLPPVPPAGTPPLTLHGGKRLPAPPAGKKTGTKVILKGKGPVTVKFGSVPKGVHCSTGKPGAPLPAPAR